jgi:hypothetical protein
MNTLATSMAIGSVLAAGWTGHAYLTETYAEKERLLVAEAQVQYVLDRQATALTREITYLEIKKNKTEDDRALLKLLREQLRETMEVRKGKK